MFISTHFFKSASIFNPYSTLSFTFKITQKRFTSTNSSLIPSHFKIELRCEKMSLVARNLFSSRFSALRWNSRHLSHFQRNNGRGYSDLRKWYFILGTGGLCVSYFAFKSLKVNFNRIYALQERKVS